MKNPATQQLKALNFNKLWHPDEWVAQNVAPVEEFDYSKIDSLVKFEGEHPEVIRPRIEKMNWQFSFDPARKKFSWKERFSRSVERATGWRPGEYRNYEII